jgi:hypothetical protein
MDPHQGASRVFGIGFSLFFCAVSVAVLGVGLYHRNLAEIATSAFMLAGGGLFLASYAVGVRVVPGSSVGGAPLMARVFLEPGEEIAEQGGGGYDFSSLPTTAMSWSNLLGHVVVTDRRVLVLPYVYSLRPVPKSIPLIEIREASKGRNAPFIGTGFARSLALIMVDGTSHNVWSSVKVIDAIARRVRTPTLVAPSPLRYDAGFPRVVQAVAAVIVFGTFGAFLLKPDPPFLRWQGAVTVFLLACVTLPLLIAGWNRLHTRAAKHA